MNNFLARVRRFQEFLVTVILHKFLVPLLLTLTYFLVVGPMSLVLKTLRQKQLRRRPLGQETYWIEAKGYDPDPEASLQQS